MFLIELEKNLKIICCLAAQYLCSYRMKIIWTPSTLWCSGYHYKTSLNKAWTQVLRRLKSCLRHVGDLGWWESLTMVWAGNKAKRLLSVNHTTKKKKKKKKKKMMNLTYPTCQESNLPCQAPTKGRLSLYHKIFGHQHISRKLCNPYSKNKGSSYKLL